MSIPSLFYPSVVVIVAAAHRMVVVGNSVQVSRLGSDFPEEAPLALYLYQKYKGKKSILC